MRSAFLAMSLLFTFSFSSLSVRLPIAFAQVGNGNTANGTENDTASGQSGDTRRVVQDQDTSAKDQDDTESTLANEITVRIAEVDVSHPRLFFSAADEEALLAKIDADPLLKAATAHIRQMASEMLDLPPVERQQVGRRLLGVSRTCLRRVCYLAFAYRVTDDPAFAARAEQEMLAAAAFTDWNPSHFLDVAEMTAALAIGYDWLYDALAPESRTIIKQAIFEKGLRQSLSGGSWVATTNNWNQVCHGGLVLGALATLESDRTLAAQIVDRAVTHVPLAMREYAPDGAYPEGPGYWKYGTTYNILLLSALESVLGTDFDLASAAGFLASSDYYQQVTSPTGLYFNYSDCGRSGGIAPAMYWFAQEREMPSLGWHERLALERFLAQDHSALGSSERLLPLLVIWAPAASEPDAPLITNWMGRGVSPVGVHRTGWNSDQELFVGIKGGSPGANHAHMDIGTFVVDALGVRWAEDLGAQSYHSLESQGIQLWNRSQNSQRWDVFRLNNFSHNTLVVDGQKQRVDSYAPIVDFSAEEPRPHTVVDMSETYRDQLASVWRGIGIDEKRSIIIQDELTTRDRQTTVRWGMVTRADVTLGDDATALLTQNGQAMQLSVVKPPDVALELFNTAQPPQTYDANNEGTCMVGFQVVLPPMTDARLIVTLQSADSTDESIEAKPLAEW